MRDIDVLMWVVGICTVSGIIFVTWDTVRTFKMIKNRKPNQRLR